MSMFKSGPTSMTFSHRISGSALTQRIPLWNGKINLSWGLNPSTPRLSKNLRSQENMEASTEWCIVPAYDSSQTRPAGSIGNRPNVDADHGSFCPQWHVERRSFKLAGVERDRVIC